jgi:hypothetical protein
MERIETRMDGGISTKITVYIYGQQLKNNQNKVRYFRNEKSARKEAEKIIKARRAHIGL